jgi:GNAT superfamily N-acetyltransferase
MACTVRPFRVAAASNAEREAVVALRRILDDDLLPGDPPVPASQVLQVEFRPGSPGRRVFVHWVSWADDGRAAGYLKLEASYLEEHRRVADVELYRDPAHRVDEVADGLLAAALEWARHDGRTSLVTYGPLSDEQDTMWVDRGLPRRYEERISRLDVSRVDPGLMAGWVQRPADDDYRLSGWVGLCPDELLSGYLDILVHMADAPLGDLDWEVGRMTPDHFREVESAFVASGLDRRALLAVHEPSGDVVGLTETMVNGHDPVHSFQGNTVVRRDHRGHGLGRWLKGAMWHQLRAECPEVRFLETDNAESNDHMLAINVAMGFAPLYTAAAWQVDIDRVSLPSVARS